MSTAVKKEIEKVEECYWCDGCEEICRGEPDHHEVYRTENYCQYETVDGDTFTFEYDVMEVWECDGDHYLRTEPEVKSGWRCPDCSTIFFCRDQAKKCCG